MSARQDTVSSLHSQEERCQQDRAQCPPFIRRRDVSKTGLSVLPSSGGEMSARQDSVSSLHRLLHGEDMSGARMSFAIILIPARHRLNYEIDYNK